jgi:hypothetical protein
MTADYVGDRRAALGWLTGGGILAALSLAVNRARGADSEIDLAKVPKAVKDAAARMLPKATWLSATKVGDGGKDAYELDGHDGKQRDVTILITADGKVVEWETELKNPANVPEKVLKAVKDRWPRFEPTESHHIRQGKDLRGRDDGDHLYDLRGTIAKGRHVQLQVSAAGAVLESVVEVPLEKVPGAVIQALKKARPRFAIGTVYAVREDKALIGYHFEGTGPKGRDRTISVTPDGKQVEVVE